MRTGAVIVGERGTWDPSSLCACLEDVLQKFEEQPYLEGKTYQGFLLNVSNSALNVQSAVLGGGMCLLQNC